MTFRAPLAFGFATLFFLLGGLGFWSATTRIAGAVIAQGYVEVAQNRQIVQHPDGGVVVAIAVSESQLVKAGDLLLRLDDRQLRSELTLVEGRLFELWAQRSRFDAEGRDAAVVDYPANLRRMAETRPAVASLLRGQTSLFLDRRDGFLRQAEQLDKRSQQIAAQIEGVVAQSLAMSAQLALVRQELADQEGLLAKGLAQASHVLALRREEAQLLGDQGELTASRAQAEGRATEVVLEKLRLAALRREEAGSQLRDLATEERELAERRQDLTDHIASLEIRAPVSGIVLGLQVTTPRAVIRPAEPILYLIPQDRPLVVAVQISPLHIDEVRMGQSVRLVLSAFSGRAMPELTGRIAHISADVLTDTQSHARYFRAEIQLDSPAPTGPDGKELLPGMPVEAFIQTESRTALAYLWQPFADYFRRAFRES